MAKRLIRLMAAFSTVLASGCIREGSLPDIRYDPNAGPTPIATESPRRGPDSARVMLVEFGDFQCSYCGDAEPTVKRVLSTYPQDVALVFVNMPLSMHQYAVGASEAFLAAARQGMAWEMHDQMFAHQSALADADLDRYAAAIGLDVAQFDVDRASPEIAKQVADDKAMAISRGVTGTPSFFVDGYWLVGAQPFSAFKEVIDKILSQL
jgi:protein-disulfide isomerase